MFRGYRGFGTPLTNEQRKQRHSKLYGDTELPPRGTGLLKGGVMTEEYFDLGYDRPTIEPTFEILPARNTVTTVPTDKQIQQMVGVEEQMRKGIIWGTFLGIAIGGVGGYFLGALINKFKSSRA